MPAPHGAEPTTLTITHTAGDGTLIDGTTKDDGASQVLASHGWRYSKAVGWYVPHSRDRPPKTHLLAATVADLEAAGFAVCTQLDHTLRPMADVEAARILRQAQRVDALTEKAARTATAADSAETTASSLSKMLPLGQPILVGHHSEAKMRRHFDRIDQTTRVSVVASDAARLAADRAAAAARTTDARYSPLAVARRIGRLEVEQRRHQRAVDAFADETPDELSASASQLERLRAANADLLAQLVYWRGIREEQIAAGLVVTYSSDAIAKGDGVKHRRRWGLVKRVNPKTVTVEWGDCTSTVPYAELEGHVPATPGA